MMSRAVHQSIIVPSRASSLAPPSPTASGPLLAAPLPMSRSPSFSVLVATVSSSLSVRLPSSYGAPPLPLLSLSRFVGTAWLSLGHPRPRPPACFVYMGPVPVVASARRGFSHVFLRLRSFCAPPPSCPSLLRCARSPPGLPFFHLWDVVFRSADPASSLLVFYCALATFY